MRKLTGFLFLVFFVCGISFAAHAEFVISSAILEFKADGPKQQDIELINRADTNDYIVSEINEIVNPGAANETRRLIEDPSQGGLLVTPDKTILAAGSRRVLRFVVVDDNAEQERIYRVAIKPVVKGIEHQSRIGLKILVGYEVLVIVRPAVMKPSYQAQRNGTHFTVTNNGNTNILFQNAVQCPEKDKCPLPPVLRVYAGQTASIELPLDHAVTYSVWDGDAVTEQSYP